MRDLPVSIILHRHEGGEIAINVSDVTLITQRADFLGGSVVISRTMEPFVIVESPAEYMAKANTAIKEALEDPARLLLEL